MRAHNVMEDIVSKYLDEMFSMRFDICTCDICRQDVMAYVLTRLSPKYVTGDSGAVNTLMEQVRAEQSSLVLKEIVNAVRLISEHPRHQKGQDHEEAYQLLMKQIKIDRGADFSQYRDRVLKRRIALRMRAHEVKSYSEYLQVLIHTPEEYEHLFEVLTINVSSFFRDKSVWDQLRDEVFPEIIRAKRAQHGLKKIRIWSAGCSHGEEPYSLAILLYELLENDDAGIRVEIIGTDIDKECLRQAEKGRYGLESMKGMSPHYLRRFFIAVKDEFQVVPHVQAMVKFKDCNLITDPGIDAVDMVICRNVFIYFNRSLQEHLIMKYYDALNKDGFFVMGNSENLLGEARHVFKVIDSMHRIYQKIETKRR
ncbi:MAG: late competence development ComFB family protein [Candidatus Omnitrophica bacterium]|nr:late competence development ComFB family protein [Candidatus Omnitrophota bacterium]